MRERKKRKKEVEERNVLSRTEESRDARALYNKSRQRYRRGFLAVLLAAFLSPVLGSRGNCQQIFLAASAE